MSRATAVSVVLGSISLGHAFAQQTPQPVPPPLPQPATPTPPPPPAPPGAEPIPDNGIKPKVPTVRARRGVTPPRTGKPTFVAPPAEGAMPDEGTIPATGAEPDGLPANNIKPFETGIEYKSVSPNARVTFNLEDADLPELVRLMSQITGRSFILPSKARSIKATVYAPTKVTAAEAYQAFLSILELNGMALVPSGRYFKIVESGRVEGRAVPLFTGDEAVPTGDRYVTRLQAVKNIAAEDASQLLERFKSGDGSLTAYAPTNMLIMTDTGTNIRRMLRILDVVDVTRTGEQIWVEPVHHATATDLAQRLSDLFDVGKDPKAKDAKKPAPGTATIGGSDARLTKVLADERTNSLIIVATEAAYLRILEMLKQLDGSMEGEGKIHVHHLQHSSAEEVANTLTNLVGKGGDKKDSGSVFEGKVAITAHKASNALVVTSSAHDFAALRSVINLLDSERKQVFIEAVIMDLTVNRSSSWGVAYHGGIPNSPTDNAVSVLGFNAGKTVGGLIGAATSGEFLTGLAVGVQGPNISETAIGLSIPAFGVALHAMAASGEANVLSTPHLIASDNVEAEISVGENVPLQTSAVGGVGSNLGALGGLLGAGGLAGGQQNPAALLGGLGGLGAFGGTVPRQDVGTTVTITPHLNEANEIRLEIAEEISSAGPPEQTGNLGVRSISRTKAKTEVVVRDQHTVVIGGLMRDQMTTSASKVPILGDMPLIGALFRSTEKSKVKKNLLLFLTPYVIRSPADLTSIYERKMRERQEFVDRYFVFSEGEYEAPVDYSRTRGLLGEMFKEIASLDAERKQAAEDAVKTEPGHDPKPPIGIAPALRGVNGDLEPAAANPGSAVIPPPPGEAPMPGQIAAPAPPTNAASNAPPPPPPPPAAGTIPPAAPPAAGNE
ncbi:MAG TPA: type II secretion system secretin GspD [Polyangiales bacterium]|nr:type II secretion system secretin GspD [Polyangiales bacterium]